MPKSTDQEARATATKRACEIRNEIKRLAEELKTMPWDGDGFINWNLHRAARVLITNTQNITSAVR